MELPGSPCTRNGRAAGGRYGAINRAVSTASCAAVAPVKGILEAPNSLYPSKIPYCASLHLHGLRQFFRGSVHPKESLFQPQCWNKSIETAQKRIEQRNAAIRKHTLEYDDVMNKQRQEIYAFRNDVLHVEDVEALAIELQKAFAHKGPRNSSKAAISKADGILKASVNGFTSVSPSASRSSTFHEDLLEINDLEKKASDQIIAAFKQRLANENAKLPPLMVKGTEKPLLPANEAIRNIIIRKVDAGKEHLLQMDHLRTDVNLRAVGNRDPLMEFKHDAFAFFDEFSRTLRTDIAQDLFRFEMVMRPTPTIQEMLANPQARNDPLICS